MQRTAQVGGPAFKKQLHVTHRFLIGIRRGQLLNARAQATPDVVLQARSRMKACEINLARWDQKIAVDQIDDAVRQVGREVRTVVSVAVFRKRRVT